MASPLAHDVECIAIFILDLFIYLFIRCCLLFLIIISEHIEGSTDVSFQTQFLLFVQIFMNKKVPKNQYFSHL
jgi:hypothetical protein